MTAARTPFVSQIVKRNGIGPLYRVHAIRSAASGRFDALISRTSSNVSHWIPTDALSAA